MLFLAIEVNLLPLIEAYNELVNGIKYSNIVMTMSLGYILFLLVHSEFVIRRCFFYEKCFAEM